MSNEFDTKRIANFLSLVSMGMEKLDLHSRLLEIEKQMPPFNFGEWLESIGWKRDTMISLKTYKKITQHGDYHRIMLYDDCMELHLVDLGGTILQEFIKDNCIAPTTQQEAATLFKLFRL